MIWRRKTFWADLLTLIYILMGLIALSILVDEAHACGDYTQAPVPIIKVIVP